MLERSLDMAIDVPIGVLFFTALVAATSAAVVVFLRAKDAAAREYAVAREREAVLKIVRAEMAAVGRALVRYTIDLHLVHDLPVPDHVWTARNLALVDDTDGDANNAPTNTPNSDTAPVREDATNDEDVNHYADANSNTNSNANANANANDAATDNEDDADDGNDGNDSDIGDEGGDTTVEYSMPESTASERYHREIMIEEYAEERREYAYGDGADWFDAMMRMRQADY